MFSDDRPITAEDQDRFGYDQIAQNLGQAIADLPKGVGVTIGIEGKWGAGKTSLTNLLVEKLMKFEGQSIRVFKFSPWLFPSSKSYAVEFLSALAAAIDKTPNNSTVQERAFGSFVNATRGRQKSRNISLADRVRHYSAEIMGIAASALKLGEKGKPALVGPRLIVEASANGLKSFKITESADSQKSGIITELKREATKYVVVVDDLDRLEPMEALEVMRLIRSIADFPNVVYVLCYDRDTLAHAVEEGLSITNGNSYLEKIVQLSFTLPQPEAFDLRDWALSELAEVYRSATGEYYDAAARKRLVRVFDFYALQLTTPRQVRRLVSAAAFHFRPVKSDVDFADLCWIQGAKIFAPSLYSWAASYLPEMAVILSAGFHATDVERKVFSEKLQLALTELGDASDRSILQLSNFLPGISPTLRKEESVRIFSDVRKEVQATLESGRRLGSPAHFRYYFAFSPPRDAMPEAELNGLIELLKTDEIKVGKAMLRLASEKRPVGGDWLNYFFDRLTRIGVGQFEDVQLVNLSVAIANTIDQASNADLYRSPFAPPSAYDIATDLVLEAFRGLKDRASPEFEPCLLGVANGKSIGWLLEDLLETELRHHGLKAKGAIERPYLDAEDLATLKEVISGRLDLPEVLAELNNSTKMLSTIYRWRELDDDDPTRVRAWLDSVLVGDHEFVSLLTRLRSYRATTDRVDYLLREPALGDFLDWDVLVARLEGIARDTENNGPLAKRAEELLESIRLGAEDW